MEYKRQLGHRVVPREPFLNLLAQHRGEFRQATPLKGGENAESAAEGTTEVPDKYGAMAPAVVVRFKVLVDGDKIDDGKLIEV